MNISKKVKAKKPYPINISSNTYTVIKVIEEENEYYGSVKDLGIDNFDIHEAHIIRVVSKNGHLKRFIKHQGPINKFY